MQILHPGGSIPPLFLKGWRADTQVDTLIVPMAVVVAMPPVAASALDARFGENETLCLHVGGEQHAESPEPHPSKEARSFIPYDSCPS